MTKKSLGDVEKLVSRTESRKSRRLLRGDVELLLTLYKEGVSAGYLAAKFGISRQAVCKHLKNHGVEARSSRDYYDRYFGSLDTVVERKVKRGLLK